MTRPVFRQRLLSAFLAALFVLTALPLVPAEAAGEGISVEASGAIVTDFQTGEVYFEKNADVARPAASMSKLMSVYLVFQAIHAGMLRYDTPVPVSAYAAGISNNRTYSGYEQFKEGEAPTVDALLKMILTASCNASMIALAEYVGGGSEAAFTGMMNAKAESWNIDAHFADSTGFTDKGNAVSPRAMAEIARRAMTDFPELLTYTSLSSTQYRGKTYNTTNTLLKNSAIQGVDGLKTGFTYGAGYCFTGTAQRDGVRIISVVMNTTSGSARMNESKKLLEYGFACQSRQENPPGKEPAGTPGRQPENKPVNPPGDEPVNPPGSEPVSAPGSEPVSAPGSEPVSAPGSEPVSVPGNEPVSAPGSEPVSVPGNEPVSAPGNGAEIRNPFAAHSAWISTLLPQALSSGILLRTFVKIAENSPGN